eukprot:TRINITY_DN7845_c0_g1_i1.p1 TRINITY_DN7845_c0_g1~~TRINITY_DN7845_c0_g1_i1.p1  ORF type:complete len:221 (-),score=30.77 TRINITY_DN7845_c0_g1_i1:18-680(-)
MTHFKGNKPTKTLDCSSEDDKPRKFLFNTVEDLDDLQILIQKIFRSSQSLMRGISNGSLIGISTVETEQIEEAKHDGLDEAMTSADWYLFFKGLENEVYPADTVIVTEGIRPTKICQIVRGECFITKKIQENGEESSIKIAVRHAGEIFGEMSFLDPASSASASVIAGTEVEIVSLDFQYVISLMSLYSYLAPKFFKYIALLINKRLIEFERTVKISDEL